MVTSSIKTSKKNLPWTLTHYHHNCFKIVFYWFVGTYSWSIWNCRNSSTLLKAPGCYILEFCLHINLCPPLPQSPKLESYSCPEVPKLRQGLLNDLSQPPRATTYHHCHQEAAPLLVACLASSFATWKENIPECISGESLPDALRPPPPPPRSPGVTYFPGMNSRWLVSRPTLPKLLGPSAMTQAESPGIATWIVTPPSKRTCVFSPWSQAWLWAAFWTALTSTLLLSLPSLCELPHLQSGRRR